MSRIKKNLIWVAQISELFVILLANSQGPEAAAAFKRSLGSGKLEDS
jgi:hypothetical protein